MNSWILTKIRAKKRTRNNECDMIITVDPNSGIKYMVDRTKYGNYIKPWNNERGN